MSQLISEDTSEKDEVKRPRVHVFDHDGVLLNHHVQPMYYYPGVYELIQNLHTQKVLMAVASRRIANSVYSEGLLSALKHAGLDKFMELVVIQDTPKSEHLDIVRRHLNSKYGDKGWRLVLYDDLQENIDVVRKAGFEGVLCNGLNKADLL